VLLCTRNIWIAAITVYHECGSTHFSLVHCS